MENSEKKETMKIIEKDVDFGFEESSKYKQIYFVKPKLKDTPKFEINWSEGDEKFITTSKKIEGKLIKIEPSSYTWENETVNTLKFHIEWMNKKQEPILFILGTSYTSFCRSLLNTLICYNEPIQKLSVTLYENNSGYASVYILINGKKVPWKYSWDEQKQFVEEIIHPKTGKLLQKDYTELDEKLKDELFERIDIIIPGHRTVIENVGDAEQFLTKEDKKEQLEAFGEADDFIGDEGTDFFDIDDN